MTLSQSKISKSGFTLVELLVVVTIIVVLVGILTIVAFKGVDVAHKLGSNADAKRIVEGMEAYRRDYNGIYPAVGPTGGSPNTTSLNVESNDDGEDSGLTLDGGAYASSLVSALLAQDEVLNPKEQEYLVGFKVAKSTDGPGLDTSGTYAFRDRWGNPYVVIWDSNYNGQIEHPLDSTLPPIARGVIVLGQGTSDEPLSSSISGKNLRNLVKSWE